MAIPTGGEFPPGSDCAVMVEYTEDLGDGYIYVQKPSAPGAHMIYKGDDVKKGDVVIHAGSVIRPQDIGALAALGGNGCLSRGSAAGGHHVLPSLWPQGFLQDRRGRR